MAKSAESVPFSVVVMYYILSNVWAIPTYRVYQLYNVNGTHCVKSAKTKSCQQ